MKVDTKQHLMSYISSNSSIDNQNLIQVPDVTLETNDIKILMISEVVPENPDDYFYSRKPEAAFLSTTIPIFNNAGLPVQSIDDIIRKGIYITTAVKTSKSEYTISTETIKNQLPILEEEMRLFDQLKVIMLMGDVAKKAVNTIARKNTKKSIIPSTSTYKIRQNAYYYGDIRVFPSYIITGGNILIEKSKVKMIQEDIAAAVALL